MNNKNQINVNNIFSFLIYILFLFILLSSIFQFYFIQIAGSYFSLTTFTILLLFPVAIKNIKLLTWKPLFFLVLVVIFQVFSYLWSIDLKLGLRSVLGFLFFLIVTISAYKITSKYPKKILFAFILYFILLLIPLSLVVFFRIYPLAELGFLSSDISKIFINPNIIDNLSEGMRNNVFDPNKAGGFFINANVAAAFLGINALISYGFSKAYSISWLKIITFLLIVGVFFTGSKAGAILIIGLMLLAVAMFYMKNYSFSLQRVVLILFTINVVYFLLLFFISKLLESQFVQQVDSTTGIRMIIWNYGFHEFLSHPVIGLGFGGWQEGFKLYAMKYGINTGFPPHNTFLYLWAQSGIFTVLVSIVFIIFILRFGKKLIKSPHQELFGLGIAIFCSFLWTFIHGMGTNFGLLGELHMEVILASLLGYSLARLKFYKTRHTYNAT